MFPGSLAAAEEEDRHPPQGHTGHTKAAWRKQDGTRSLWNLPGRMTGEVRVGTEQTLVRWRK